MSDIVLKARINEAGYPGGFKIEDIGFELEPGEVLLVTGRSGSGKSTLLKSLTGLIRLKRGYVKGSVKVYEEELLDKPLHVVFKKLYYIPQEPWYGVVGYTVFTEYCHTLSVYGRECSIEKLGNYGLAGLADHVTYGLSAGQYQRILWAEALEINTPVILMDEPYTYIDQSGRSTFKKYVEKHLSNNGSIIVVDHIPSNWREYDPKTLVLNQGKQAYYGRYVEEVESSVEISVHKRRRVSREIVLKGVNLWYKYPSSKLVLRGVDIEVRRGEVIGVTGVNGAGKTTLLKILAGIHRPMRGWVERSGSVTYIPENPLLYYTHPTPRDEILNYARDEEFAYKVVEELELNHVLDQPLALLSTGERRRVALASALVAGYDILLLDEPTGGLDKYSVESLVSVIEYVVERGASVVIAHHDPRIKGLFDHEYLLEHGVLKCLY